MSSLHQSPVNGVKTTDNRQTDGRTDGRTDTYTHLCDARQATLHCCEFSSVDCREFPTVTRALQTTDNKTNISNIAAFIRRGSQDTATFISLAKTAKHLVFCITLL